MNEYVVLSQAVLESLARIYLFHPKIKVISKENIKCYYLNLAMSYFL
jgi:hypothetical protein